MAGSPQHHAELFQSLLAFLSRIPAILTNDTQSRGFGCGGLGHENEDGWWVKFSIDLDHPLAWNTVQELGHVLNYLTLDERPPTVFKPVSPPPHINGGPEFLSWVIECRSAEFSPSNAAALLERRLPKPVDDPGAWKFEQRQ